RCRDCTSLLATVASCRPDAGSRPDKEARVHGWTRITVGALVTALACALGAPASAAPQGGTLRVDISKSDVTSLDPALDYEYLGWGVLWATCAKLVSYPDKPAPLGAQLIPEVAAGLPRISANGRVYTFT